MKFQLTRPRGTRRRRIDGARQGAGFNSRVRGGRDGLEGIVPNGIMFQLTRPRGTRPSGLRERSTRECFNSRVRGGRDQMLKAIDYEVVVSTHASAGDATNLLGKGIGPQ